MTSNVVTYIVDIDVPNPDKLLIPYLTANVQFVVEDIRNAFLVSNAALRFRPETELVSAEQKAAFDRMQPELAAPVRDGQKKKAVVWELRDNLLYPHLVTKGESNGMLTAIAGETLREGMEIVSTAQILNRSDSSGDGSSASAGGENRLFRREGRFNAPTPALGVLLNRLEEAPSRQRSQTLTEVLQYAFRPMDDLSVGILSRRPAGEALERPEFVRYALAREAGLGRNAAARRAGWGRRNRKRKIAQAAGRNLL